MMSITKNIISSVKPKFIIKYMKIAKSLANDNNSCPSRKVGSVIINEYNRVIGVGYNGPPVDTPHCDSAEYIRDILWQKLTEEEIDRLCDVALNRAKEFKKELKQLFNADIKDLENLIKEKNPLLKNGISNILGGCNTCPRRLLGYSAGVRTDLCSCQHGERNVITNCTSSPIGGILFNWSCISCWECTGAIINARLREVHFLEGEEYSKGSLALYKSANIPVFLHNEREFNEN